MPSPRRAVEEGSGTVTIVPGPAVLLTAVPVPPQAALTVVAPYAPATLSALAALVCAPVVALYTKLNDEPVVAV